MAAPRRAVLGVAFAALLVAGTVGCTAEDGAPTPPANARDEVDPDSDGSAGGDDSGRDDTDDTGGDDPDADADAPARGSLGCDSRGIAVVQRTAPTVEPCPGLLLDPTMEGAIRRGSGGQSA